MRSSSRRARSPTRENSTVFPGWCRTPNSTSFSATIARAGRNPEHVDVRARIAVSRPAPALRAVLAGAARLHHGLPDAGRDHRLAGLRAHRQRVQSRPGRADPVRAGGRADAADRPRRRPLRPPLVRTAHGVYALAAVMIIAALLAGVLTRDLLFGAVFLIGCARAFELPTAHSLVPALVPAPMIARAVAAWTSANQVAIIFGPALGGLIYTISPTLVSAICLVFFTASITLITWVRAKGPAANREPPTFASVRPVSSISAAAAGCSASSPSTCSWCCSAAPPR